MDKPLARDVFKELDIPFRNRRYDFICHFRYLLAFFSLKIIFDQPFSHKFFGKLALGLSLLLPLREALGIKIARRIGRMDFVDEVYFTITFAKFVFRIG